MDIFEKVKSLNFPLGEYVVVGSGPLAARGIRSYKDIDILVAENLYEKLIKNGWKIIEINGVNEKFEELKNGKFEVAKRFWCGDYKPNTETLIKNAEVINGVPFMPLPELIKFKKALGREKDFKDIELIEQYLKTIKTKKTKSAGGVVKNSKGEVLVVNQWSRSWSLPKGHVENGEDMISAAKREIYEESGIKAENLEFIKELGNYKRYKSGNDKSELKHIFMFLFKTNQMNLKPIDPHNPEARWVKKKEVADLLTYEKDKEFFLKIKDKI